MKRNNEERKEPKYNSEDKKGIVLVILLAVVAAALFAVGIKAFNGEKPNVSEAPSVSAGETTESTTTAPSLPPVSETTTAPNATDPTENNNPKPTAPAPSKEPTKEDILKKVGDGVNSLKSSTASFKATKNQVMDIDLIDCSVPRFTGVVNSVIQRFLGDEVLDYDFTNGVGIDPEEGTEITSKEAIPPTNKDFTLTMEGLKDAYVKKEGENTTYTIVVVPEKGTLENPRPVHHSSACDTMDISLVEIPMGAITRADYDYAGAIVSVTYDKSGKVIKYYEKLSIAGIGEAGAIGISGSATIEGFMEETWDISWK